MFEKPYKILIDTDPGVDDAFCIAFGLAFPELLSCQAITTMGGNNTTAATTRNALALLSLYRREGIPVAAGPDRYLTEPFGEVVAKFHGENGLADQVIPDSKQKPEERPACEVIYETAKAYPGELIIVTVAPETNVALAMEKHPDLPGLLKKIVVMGGTVTSGNVTPYAEANIWHDVPAADIVFRSGVPIDMIGLNLTRQCVVSEERFTALAKECRPAVYDFLRMLIRFRGPEPMHDAIAIATLLDEQMVAWESGRIEIHTDRDDHYGQTVLVQEEGGNMRVATTADYDRYEALFMQAANFFSENQGLEDAPCSL